MRFERTQQLIAGTLILYLFFALELYDWFSRKTVKNDSQQFGISGFASW